MKPGELFYADKIEQPMLLGFSVSDLLPLRRACDMLQLTPKDFLRFALEAEESKLRRRAAEMREELKRL